MVISTFHLVTYGFSFASIKEAHKKVLAGQKSNSFANEVQNQQGWNQRGCTTGTT
jgi:hypothetical protein